MIEEQGERFQAEQATRFAKSGVMIDSGSPLATLMDTAVRIERNAMKTRLSGEWDAGGLTPQRRLTTRWRSPVIGGAYGAACTFLSGAKMQSGAYSPSTSQTPYITEN
jgi:hypothetical protein